EMFIIDRYIQGATFTCSDLPTARKNCETAYNSAVDLFAYLCKKFGFDPLADGVIVSHCEGHKRGIASNHGDPEHLWRGLGMPYTMDGFRKDVAAAMGKSTEDKLADTAKYYVQVGAFASKANAEAYLAKVKKTYPDAFIKTF
ncbi:MAG: SPOR domain-containing protein, partial [Oscillospiraceae bacterium]|nr:SPOR domain-containing protein [Oscillospiraceae bacterium]